MLQTLSSELCPSPLPALSGNVYCIGRNYADHAKELNSEIPKEPVIFLKAPSALRLADQGPLAFANEEFHYEAELVLLVSRHKSMGSKTSSDDIAGLTLGLDLTRRSMQEQLKQKGLPWTICKSFAGAGILCPFIPSQQIKNWNGIDFSLNVRGELKQKATNDLMLFSFTQIMDYLLGLQDLYPGDLIYTGTPAGVGPIRKGDEFVLKSEALGLEKVGRL